MSLHEDRLRRLTRLFIIAAKLQAGGRVTLSNLAEMCNCSTRTIFRDLTYLAEAGVAYHYDASRRSYVLDGPLHLLTVHFNLFEVLALTLAQEAVRGQLGPVLEASVHSAFEKVIHLIPPNVQSKLRDAPRRISFQSSTRRDYTAVPWHELIAAIQNQVTVEMNYYTMSRDALTTRRVDPYQLAFRQGYWHLVGYCHTRRDVRLFALDNIQGLRLTGESFEIPANFSLADFMRGSVGVLRGELTEITVRFDPPVARWARRRRWTFPCTLAEEKDGSLILRGTVAGLEEICRELLQWGGHVCVLEPATLREKMRSMAAAIVSRYEGCHS
jgi:predicted DNA-binding transcriptional regulator YafY